MAEEDNFDIDIYGDDVPQDDGSADQVKDETTQSNGQSNVVGLGSGIKQENQPSLPPLVASQDASHITQGTKRKAEVDERPIDPNASHAVQIVELHWWVTEDDVRGWCARSGSEAELKDLTFNEHKVNGKSKGSQAAATAAKQYVDHTDTIKDPKRPIASYFHGPHNPYKTLPKDNARRTDNRSNDRSSSSGNNNFTNHNNNFSGNNNFRGRGNFGGNRGNNVNVGFNRGGFQGNMNSMNNMSTVNAMPYNNMNGAFNNFNRGGMMGGMRGGMQPNRGRGGMVGGMNPMMGQMGGMNMGAMAMGAMGMPNGMMGMGGGFPAQPFNAGFFQGQNSGAGTGAGAGAGAGGWDNQHPAKRARPNE